MDTAAKILEAADTLFCERGYDGASVRDIAEHAGVNKALVFYHHDTKEALFGRVVDRYYQGHVQALQAAFEGCGPLTKRMHRLIDAYLDYISAHRGFPLLVRARVSGGADVALVRRGLTPLLEWTERALADITPPAGPLAARHFFLTFSGAVITTFTSGPVLAPAWGSDPLSAEGLEERRAHLHWLVDTLLARLEASELPRG